MAKNRVSYVRGHRIGARPDSGSRPEHHADFAQHLVRDWPGMAFAFPGTPDFDEARFALEAAGVPVQIVPDAR